MEISNIGYFVLEQLDKGSGEIAIPLTILFMFFFLAMSPISYISYVLEEKKTTVKDK